MRIELVGGLGIGKSTLCNALEKIGFHCIYENLVTNPFLADCFNEPEKFRFPSQMWFILSKYHEIQKQELANRINVLDQSVLNVRAYTNMLFGQSDPEAMAIINQCFQYMEQQTGKPDLLINLQCSAEQQMARIRKRNRDHEKSVTLDYITSLQDEIDALLLSAQQSGCRVLNVDTESFALPDALEFAHDVVQKIADMFPPNSDMYSPLPALMKMPKSGRFEEHEHALATSADIRRRLVAV